MTSEAWAILREVRARSGLSQRALAEKAGVTPATIARIEKARMEPTLDLLDRIVRGSGLELGIVLRDPDSDDAKARRLTRTLSLEDRLRQNDRLSKIRTVR